MPKVTNILGNNKVPACESRDFVLKKKTVPKKLHFDTAPCFFYMNLLLCSIDKTPKIS